MSKLANIFSSVLGIDESKVTPELSPETAATWDSLNAMILLSEIERAFAVRFDYTEAMNIKNFSDVCALVAAKGKDPYE
jgi:acyl carrier protein